MASWRRRLPSLLGAIVCFTLALTASSASAVIITWTGTAADGQWHTPSNWSLNRIPGAGDDVVIPNLAGTTAVTYGQNVITTVNSLACSEPLVLPTGGLNLAAASSFANGLTMSDASITGTGNVSITGPGFDWRTGTFTGSGTLTIQPGVTWTMSGVELSSSPSIDRTLDNFGTLVVTQTRGFAVQGAGTFRNQSGGIVDFRSDGTIGLNGGFQNLAGSTFRRSTSAGTGLVQGGTFTNAGTIDVQTGTLLFPFITVTHTGSLTVAPGAILSFSGANFTAGAGSLVVVNGSLLIPQFSNLTFDPAMSLLTLASASFSGGNVSIGPNLTIPSLALSGGTGITGAGNLTVTNAFTWSGATIGGTGTLTLPAGLTWTMPLDPTNSSPNLGRTLNNDGTGIQTNPNGMRIQGLFRNRSGGVFDCRVANITIDGAGSFENQAGATFRRSTTSGTTNLTVAFSNAGTLEVNGPVPTVLLIGHDHAQQAGSTLRVRVDAAEASKVDRLDVIGTVSLAGTLTVDLSNAGIFAIATPVTIISASTARVGTFGTVNFIGRANVTGFGVQYSGNSVQIVYNAVTDVDPRAGLPEVLALRGGVAAPDRARFELALPAAADVRVEVYDATGRHVATLADERLEAGIHRLPLGAAAHRGALFARAVVRTQAAGTTAHEETRTARLVIR